MAQEERTILSKHQKSEILQIIADRNFKFAGKPWIEEASEVSYKISKPIDREITIKKSNLFYFIYLPYILLVIGLFQLGFNFFSGLDIILVVTFTYAIIQDNKVVKRITINETGINGDDTVVAWPNISGIYITHYGRSRSQTIDILWLALTDGSYQEFNISSYTYNGIGHTVAHYMYIYNLNGAKVS